MDRFLIYVLALCLGRSCARAAQELDTSNMLTGLFTQLMAAASQLQPSQSTISGESTAFSNSGQAAAVPNSGAAIPDIQNMFRSMWPNNGNQTMDYDLSQVMQMMNASYGVPQVADSKDTSSMNKSQVLDYVQNQTNSFSKMWNSDMAMWLEPDRVVNYLNITSKMYDPSTANNPEAQASLRKQYQDLMTDYQRSFEESVNGKKTENTADPASSAAMLEMLQTHMSNMTAMYNRELNNALPPEDVKGFLEGIQNDNVAANFQNALLNIFQNISQGLNDPLKWQGSE